MNCVILQPSYIPWRGYFHQIKKADVFVFYDDVQYDKHSWRNRNRVKTPQGGQWLTIPVKSKGNVAQGIATNAIRIDWTQDWTKKHWSTIKQAYGKAPYFRHFAPILEEFLGRRMEFLADFTINLTMALARELGLTTQFVRSSTLDVRGKQTDRLVNILQKLHATHYISGPSARDYLEDKKLSEAGITLEFMLYQYPEYPQLYPPFDPQVSIIDLLFMTGPKAPKFIWG